jgi:hypothetical protein
VTEAFSQDDFDFRWVPPNLRAVTRRYECAREAVTQAGLVLPFKRHPDPVLDKIADYYDLRIDERTFDGAIWQLRFWEPGPADFPRSAFKLVLPKLKDPQELSRSLTNSVVIYVPDGLSRQQASQYCINEYVREGASSQRGQGASLRRDETLLKYLGARRVINHLLCTKGLQDFERLQGDRAGRFVRSALLADAKAFTQETLGKPLLHSDQEWIKAYRVITRVVARLQCEIDWLRELFSHDPPLLANYLRF